MFSYVFCDGMKLIQDAILLRLASPYVLSSWGFGLYSCRRNLPAQAGCQTTKSEDGSQAFQLLQLHYIWCGGRGEGAVKITKRSRGGAELIPLLWTGGHYIIIFPLKLISQFPLLIIIGQSLTVVAKFLDLDNDGHCIFERWKRKVWTTVLLLSAIVHRLRRCQYFFGFFFLPYLQDLGLLKSRNFARMATWLNDFFYLLWKERVFPSGVYLTRSHLTCSPRATVVRNS